jgi:hypothetical protein
MSAAYDYRHAREGGHPVVKMTFYEFVILYPLTFGLTPLTFYV